MREDVGQDPESAMAQRPLDTVALDRYWQQAQRWVGALPKQTSWSREYWQSMQPVPLGSELDLESSLEADPFLHSFWIQTQIPRGTAVSLCMDASMSIAGEKKEWSALALASFLLLFQALPHRVVFFESTARTFDEKATFRDVLAKWRL